MYSVFPFVLFFGSTFHFKSKDDFTQIQWYIVWWCVIGLTSLIRKWATWNIWQAYKWLCVFLASFFKSTCLEEFGQKQNKSVVSLRRHSSCGVWWKDRVGSGQPRLWGANFSFFFFEENSKEVPHALACAGALLQTVTNKWFRINNLTCEDLNPLTERIKSNLILISRNPVFIVIEEVVFPSDTCSSLSLANSSDYLNVLGLTTPSIFFFLWKEKCLSIPHSKYGVSCACARNLPCSASP